MGRKIRMLIVTFVIASLFIMVSMGSVFAQQTTLTVWWWQHWPNCMGPAIDDFLEQNPDITLEQTVMGTGDVYDSLFLALAAGAGTPDIVALESSYIGKFVEVGGLADITDRISPWIDKMDPSKWADMTDRKGRICGMPVDSGPVAIWYRRDVFEQAGLPSDPESVAELLDTWDDYYEVAKIIKAKTNKYMLPLAKANYDFRIFEILLWQQEAGYVDREGKLNINNPEAVRILEYLGKFWKEDLALDAGGWSTGWYAGLTDGEVATLPEATWMGGCFANWICPETAGLWGVVPLPVWEEGGVRSSNDGGSNIAITAASENKEAAWKFIEFLFTNPDYMVDAWRREDWFPSLILTYDDPFVDEVVPFTGQVHRRIFADAAQIIPWWVYTPDYAEMNSIMQIYVSAYALGDMESAEEVLAQTATEITVRTGRE